MQSKYNQNLDLMSRWLLSYKDNAITYEDIIQSVRLLGVMGVPPQRGLIYILRARDKFSKRKLKGEARTQYIEVEPCLKTVLFPEDEELEKIPPYHRYVGLLLHSHTTEEVAKKLSTNRMDLWRWMKEQGYSFGGFTRS